jgi:hypothetical protein
MNSAYMAGLGHNVSWVAPGQSVVQGISRGSNGVSRLRAFIVDETEYLRRFSLLRAILENWTRGLLSTNREHNVVELLIQDRGCTFMVRANGCKDQFVQLYAGV